MVSTDENLLSWRSLVNKVRSNSHKVFTAKCDFRFWNQIREFFFFLSQDKQEDMKTILEGIDPAKHQVRVAFDACKLQY